MRDKSQRCASMCSEIRGSAGGRLVHPENKVMQSNIVTKQVQIISYAEGVDSSKTIPLGRVHFMLSKLFEAVKLRLVIQFDAKKIFLRGLILLGLNGSTSTCLTPLVFI